MPVAPSSVEADGDGGGEGMKVAERGRAWLRRRYLERPGRYRVPYSVDVAAYTSRLRQDGYVVLPGFFNGLSRARENFERELSGVGLDEYRQRVFKGAEAFQRFRKIATNPLIVEIIASYWGRKVGITDFAGKRLEPFEGKYDAFQWHHDGEGKRTRMLVYLTDVGEGDQCFAYVPTTHRFHWSPDIPYFSNDDWNIQGPVNVYGPAGTAIIFDANGLHRGYRTKGAVRDSLNFRYQPQSFWRWTSGPWRPRKFLWVQ